MEGVLQIDEKMRALDGNPEKLMEIDDMSTMKDSACIQSFPKDIPGRDSGDAKARRRRRRRRIRMRKRRAKKRQMQEGLNALQAPIKVHQPPWNPFGKTPYFSVHEFMSENEEGKQRKRGDRRRQHKGSGADSEANLVVTDQWKFVNPPSVCVEFRHLQRMVKT